MGQIINNSESSAATSQDHKQTCETKSNENQKQIHCNDLDLFKNIMKSTGFIWSFYQSRRKYKEDWERCPEPPGLPGCWPGDSEGLPHHVLPNIIHVRVPLERFAESVKETRWSTCFEKQETKDRLSKQKERIKNFLKLLYVMTHSYAPDDSGYQEKLEIVRPIPEKKSLMEEIDRRNAQKTQEYNCVLLEYKKIKEQLNILTYGTKEHYFYQEHEESYRGPMKEPYPEFCFETITICSFPEYIDFLCRRGTPEFDFLVSNNRVSEQNRTILVWDGKPI